MKKPLLYLFVFVAIQFAASLGMQALFRLFDPSPGLMTLQMLVSMSLFAVVTIAVFLYTKWSLVSPHYLRTRPWAVLCWSVLAALGAIIPSVWLQEQLPVLPNVMEESFSMILKGRWGYVVVGLLAPVAEEIVFRGAILRTLLQKFGPWQAIWISAVLFALVHGEKLREPHREIVIHLGAGHEVERLHLVFQVHVAVIVDFRLVAHLFEDAFDFLFLFVHRLKCEV